MGAGGVTNCGTNATDARSLKKTGKPNSKVQRYNQKGELVQERWYDYLGRAIRNRDYSQSGEMPFPHDHDWAWENGEGQRIKEHVAPDYIKYH